MFAILCDWRGRCTWANGENPWVNVGQFVWEPLSQDSQERAKASLAQTVALRKTQRLEVVHKDGARFRGWLWPLDLPEMAVCILGLRIPANLVDLTDRERACLELLAQGLDTRSIAEKLDVSVSTLHTHLRHARDKLGLASMESLISFAARYCYPTTVPLDAAGGG